MSEEILQPETPAKFGARNLRPKFRRLRAGDLFLIEMECEESIWNTLRTVPENALLEVVLWHHDGDPDPAAKPAENGKPEKVENDGYRYNKPKPEPVEKGPHSGYWRGLFQNGFQNFPDLRQVLNVNEPKQVKDALHEHLGCTSLTTIAPSVFELWLQGHGLDALITLSRQVQARNGE